MGEPLTLHVRNRVDAIAPASEAAEAWLAAQHAGPQVSFFVSLAIEELVTNCIKYGYDDDGEHVIDIALSLTDQKLTMVFVDDGHAFNPLKAPSPDLPPGIEGRPTGGFGIPLVREFADEIAYERSDGANRLTLVKRSI